MNVFIVFIKFLSWIVAIWVRLARFNKKKRGLKFWKGGANYKNKIYNNYIYIYIDINWTQGGPGPPLRSVPDNNGTIFKNFGKWATVDLCLVVYCSSKLITKNNFIFLKWSGWLLLVFVEVIYYFIVLTSCFYYFKWSVKKIELLIIWYKVYCKVIC